MKIILNILGILIYFINRYARRTKKTISFSLKYWLEDNWPEMSTIILLDIALMILLLGEGSEINFDEIFAKLPFGLKIAGEPLMAFLLGLGLSSLFYTLFKKKIRETKK